MSDVIDSPADAVVAPAATTPARSSRRMNSFTNMASEPSAPPPAANQDDSLAQRAAEHKPDVAPATTVAETAAQTPVSAAPAQPRSSRRMNSFSSMAGEPSAPPPAANQDDSLAQRAAEHKSDNVAANQSTPAQSTPAQSTPAATTAIPVAPAAASATVVNFPARAPAPQSDPTLATSINPPSAPRDASGALIATEEMRLRAQGIMPEGEPKVGEGEEISPADAAALAQADALSQGQDENESPGSVPPGDHAVQDPYNPPQSIDPLNHNLITCLLEMRSARRNAINERLATLEVERSTVQARHEQLVANQDMKAKAKLAASMAAANAGGGGGGSLLGGIGSGIAAVGGAIGGAISHVAGGNPERRAERKLEAISGDIANLKAVRRMDVDHRMVKTIEAADNMYKAHRVMTDRIVDFNTKFGQTPEGQAYLGAIQTVADNRGISTAQVREAMHADRGNDPEISALVSRTREIIKHPVVAEHIDTVENLSRMVRSNADRMTKGLELAAKSGTPVEDLDGRFTDSLSAMQGEDSVIARPGGERIDALKGRIKEMTDKIVEIVRDIIARFKSAVGLGSAQPSQP